MLTQFILPLRGRSLLGAVLSILAGLTYLALFPNVFLVIGRRNVAPVWLTPTLYVPMILTLCLAITLSPRLPDLERYGSKRTRLTALSSIAFIICCPLLLFWLGFHHAVPVLDVGESTAMWQNVVIVSLLSIIIVGVCGRVLGSILTAASVYAVFVWQSTAPAALGLGPFIGGIHLDGTVDTAERWTWLAALLLAAILTGWIRRYVPFNVTIRQPEDD